MSQLLLSVNYIRTNRGIVLSEVQLQHFGGGGGILMTILYSVVLLSKNVIRQVWGSKHHNRWMVIMKVK